MLWRKGVYPYECMDSWERFGETSFPDKEAFYSSLNIEDITNIDYWYAKRVPKEFNNKNLGNYHDLYVQIDTLLIADIFENFRNKCTKMELELLTDNDMLSMVEKWIREGLCHAIHRYAKANNKYMKSYSKSKKY